MEMYEVGIRKFVESGKVEEWHSVIAKPTEEKEKFPEKVKVIKRGEKLKFFCTYFTHSAFWKVFISANILLNFFITLIAMPQDLTFFLVLAILVHLTCFFFWIDFIGALAYKKVAKDYNAKQKSRKVFTLIIDAVTLLPISLWYLLQAPDPNQLVFWCLRLITLPRIYRVQYYLAPLAVPGRNFWRIYFLFALFYLIILISLKVSVFLVWDKFSKPVIQISGYEINDFNKYLVVLYIVLAIVLNVGFGEMISYSSERIWLCNLAMVIGFITIKGVLTGVLATKLTNLEKDTVNYMNECNAIVRSLKKINTDKKVIKRVSKNMKTMWFYREGFLNPKPPLQHLPESMRKEIYFDINFGLLNRSVIFSIQKKSFLRSVSLLMKNVSYLPGDVILEPEELAHAMICIFSGVIEVVAGEHAEIVLFSLAAGSVVGESSLFISLPKHHYLRASTYVEVQVLQKEDFFRLALKHPEVCVSMRADLESRLREIRNKSSERDQPSIRELIDILKESRALMEESRKMDTFSTMTRKKIGLSWLSLYIVSDNIPKVKTTPVNLLKGNPWILRPNTFLTETWKIFNILTVFTVVFLYPILLGFVRDVSEETFMFMHFVDFVYIFDLYVQCTTAVKREDHFTYITDLKEIIILKLKSPGFYIDVVSTLNFTVYTDLSSIENKNYAFLLLSQNKILRVWNINVYFRKLENTWSTNLILLRFVKYLVYFLIIIVWAGVSLYLEACPEEVCIHDRWFSMTEKKETGMGDPEPLTEWPALLSLYWGCVIVTGVGYGDVQVTAVSDCVIVSLCIVVGAFALVYFMAEASATTKNLNRLKAQFQEEVFSVDRFMRENYIPIAIQQRVRNYFKIQWSYDKGYTFKEPQVLKDTSLGHKKILMANLIKKFLVVPFFRNCSIDFLKTLVRLSKFRILPPDEIVVERGSIGREMFILDAGYCLVSEEDNPRVEAIRIISSVNAFGFAEMVLGIPLKLNVRTLTHCKIITLDYHSYLRAVTIFPTTKIHIDEEIEREYFRKKLNGFQLLGLKPLNKEKKVEKLWLQQKIISKALINVYKFHQNLSHSYWQPFEIWGRLNFMKYLLMPIVFAPQSKLIKIWICLRMVRAIGIGVLAPPYLALPHSHLIFRCIILFLQVCGWVDIYLMFHVSYYNEDGLLVFHPSKTAISYLRGNFIVDFIIEYPLLLSFTALLQPERFSYFFHIFGLITVLQFYKFFQACMYLESDILRRTEVTKTLKFIPLAVVLTNVVTAIVLIVNCYSDKHLEWMTPKSSKVFSEFKNTLQEHCSGDFSAQGETSGFFLFKSYLIVFYWTTASLTSGGLGDLTAHNREAMGTSIIVVILGVFAYGYMFASLTSSMISSYTSVTKYRKQLLQMIKFMKLTNATDELKTRFRLHYEYNWKRTEGSKPRRLLAKVHTSLRESVMSTMYEDTIKLVPLFEVEEKSILKIIEELFENIHFLPGETVVNHNDILEHFYIIHRGIVEVLDKNGEKITLMGKGGIFGNIANKIFALSSVTVVAKKNLEVLRLQCEPFFKALEVVSDSTDLLVLFTSQTKNYLQPLMSEEDKTTIVNNKDSVMIDTLGYRKTMPIEIPYATPMNVVKYKTKKFFGILKNSLHPSTEGKVLEMVVLPDSILYDALEIFVFFLSFISGNLALYMFFYQDYSIETILACYVFDFLYLFKFPLSFVLSYTDNYGEYVVSKKKIRKRYLRSKYFIFDVTSCVPIELMALFFPEVWKLPVFTFLHLNRIFRFYYINEYFAIKSKELMANKTYLQLWWVVVCVSILIHVAAGVWYFQACPFDYCQKDCWVTQNEFAKDDKWFIFSISVYFVISLFTTTGFGDISVYTVSELLTIICSMIFSQFFLVLMAGSMATVVYDQILNVILYERILLEIKSNFKRLKLNSFQLAKVWRYLSSMWLLQTKEIPKFIKTAPYAMKCEAMYVIFGIHLSQSYVFASLEESFLRQLAAAIERSIFFNDDYIVQQGDVDHTMYFICKGQVSVLTIHSNLMETIHFTLQDNDQFGTTQGLLSGKPHQFSYRAETTVEILSLTYNNWKHLLKYFPHCETEIYERLQNLPHLKQTFVAPNKY